MISRPLGAMAAALLWLAATPVLAGDPARGKEKAAVCFACHGEQGKSPSPAFPHIGGQHEEYLLKALTDYKVGRRKNPIMAAQAANLTPSDMADLAAYFASQPGVLYLKR